MKNNSIKYILSAIDIISSIYTLCLGVLYGLDILHMGWVSIFSCSLSLVLIVSSLANKLLYSDLLFIIGAFLAMVPSITKIYTFLSINGIQQSAVILYMDADSLLSFLLDVSFVAINAGYITICLIKYRNYDRS